MSHRLQSKSKPNADKPKASHQTNGKSAIAIYAYVASVTADFRSHIYVKWL